MLTPVDIQQKKFKMGIGYDRKDVQNFFKTVSECYEQLYRSNAELKEKVNTLTDGLQNYKSKEENLQKSLMLAEKDSQEFKTKASREAKTIELEAKSKANNILFEAEEKLENLNIQIEFLQSEYTKYKSNFSTLLKQQFIMLEENDFDVSSYYNPEISGIASSKQIPNTSKYVQKQQNENEFSAFTGDPQMRDESQLKGANNFKGKNTESVRSTSAVYTSVLNDKDNFVDPFSGKNNNEVQGRYNPYNDINKKKETTSDVSQLRVSEKYQYANKKPTNLNSKSQIKYEGDIEVNNNNNNNTRSMLGDGINNSDDLGFEFVE